MPKNKPHHKAALRSRWREFLADGSLASLGSEGRLVALYVFERADWSTCEVRFSLRRAAEAMQTHITTVRRGISQLVEVGVLEVLEPGNGRSRTKYVIPLRARSVHTPDTQCARLRAQGVRAPDTPCARSEHEACAQRAHGVHTARTGGARYSVSLSGTSVSTSESISAETAVAGVRPARRLRLDRMLNTKTGDGSPVDEETKTTTAEKPFGKEYHDEPPG